MTMEIFWGKDKIELRLPESWKVIAIGEPANLPEISDLNSAVKQALDQPIGSPSLRELIPGKKKIVIVVDDLGRPTPVARIFPILIDYLRRAGWKEKISVLFALGTHRKMTKAEMMNRIGISSEDNLELLCFDCRNQEHFQFMGKTGLGTPVYLLNQAVEADLRILIGTIEPHPQAGFGGGAKLLVPGLAGAKTIGRNHLIMPGPENYNMIGTIPDQNPMRQDLEQAASFFPGNNFIVNAILNLSLLPAQIVAGDLILAHRKGVEFARAHFGVPIPSRADIVISSAYPMDMDLRQGVKGITNAAKACKKGGVIICFLRCEQGYQGKFYFPIRFSPVRFLRMILNILRPKGIYFLSRILPGLPVEIRFILNFGMQLIREYEVLVFSPRLAETTQRSLPKVLFADQQELFRKAEQILGKTDPEVIIFRAGGASFPILDGEKNARSEK